MQLSAQEIADKLESSFRQGTLHTKLNKPQLALNQPLFYRPGMPLHHSRIYLGGYEELLAGPVGDTTNVLFICPGPMGRPIAPHIENICVVDGRMPLDELMGLLQSYFDQPGEQQKQKAPAPIDPPADYGTAAAEHLRRARGYLNEQSPNWAAPFESMTAYDARHGTAFAKTFMTYTENRFNALQTARDLFIHRSTLLYRLERMEREFGVGFEQMETVLCGWMYLRFMGDKKE